MIKVIKYDISELNIRNVLRYMGERNTEPSDELMTKIMSLLPDFLKSVDGRLCFDEIDMFNAESVSLKNHLADSDHVILMAATIGIEADRRRVRAGVTSNLNALILDAFGTEAVEQVCDRFSDELKQSHEFVTSRFSPGYGDLSLDYQKEIVRILDTTRKIGLTLNDSLLMSPTKSVTAIIGIRN